MLQTTVVALRFIMLLARALRKSRLLSVMSNFDGVSSGMDNQWNAYIDVGGYTFMWEVNNYGGGQSKHKQYLYKQCMHW